jgi:hypothetical protein
MSDENNFSRQPRGAELDCESEPRDSNDLTAERKEIRGVSPEQWGAADHGNGWPPSTWSMST